jgi:recombination associated protein RdgC
MDFVDLIAEKRFLGQEFMTWLWYKSEERGGTVFLPEAGDIQIVFEKHMLLEYGEGEAHEKLICRGLQTELREARTGLQMGKKLEQARIHLVRGHYEWNFTLTAAMLEFRNIRVPKTVAAADEETDQSAIEARLLERIGMVEEAVRTINELFRMYLQTRISSDWEGELGKVQRWVRKAAVA